jgi:hypothetical protein
MSDSSNPTSEIMTCGIIMPIAKSTDYTAEHWLDVKEIISECIIEAGFDPRLVSEASDTGMIHQRIVENIYSNPIVVCDISSRNPNVMFELGIRLTFDKPVVIIKDDNTERIFDTDIIEYLPYPKDLKYSSIQNFKKALTKKIIATYNKYKDTEESIFIKHFKNVKPQKLQDEELNSTQQILRAIDGLRMESQASKIKSINSENLIDPENAARRHPFNDYEIKSALETILERYYDGNYKNMRELVDENFRKRLRRALYDLSGAIGHGVLSKVLTDAVERAMASLKMAVTYDDLKSSTI